MNTKEIIKKLNSEIEKYNYYYYAKNESIISDSGYDILLKKLQKYEKEYPQYSEEITATKIVGTDIQNSTKFNKIKHNIKMLSLSNTYNIDDINAFDKRVKKIVELENIEYVVELKLDGLGISVIYEDGKLKKAITRGDGKTGEDVTENVMQIKSIPHFLKENLSFEVRGEIVLPKTEFKRLNLLRVGNDEEEFANPRNAASGTLRQLDKDIVKERNLDCYFYYLVEAKNYDIKTHLESITFLKKADLKTTNYFKLCKNEKDISDQIKILQEKKEDLDYEIDGLVIKVNDLNLYDKLGNTSKSPRWAISYKFPAIRVTTKLNHVTFQIGRTGMIIPVAELEPVFISGSLVKRASLHNFEEIKRKDIRIGDTVFIEKAAEIIPQVIKSVKEVRTGTEKSIELPQNCPACDSLLEKESTYLKCKNLNCSAKIFKKIEYFVSRNAMNIENLGPKIISKLIELKKITTISDIYKLNNFREELEKIEKLGKKSIDNILHNIENSKNTTLAKFIYSLGIYNIGSYVSNLIAQKISTIDELKDISKEKLLEIKGIGEKAANSFVKYFENCENIAEIENLNKIGFLFNKIITQDKENFFYGKSILITGSFKAYSRNDLKDIIVKMGGTNSTSVSKGLDIILVGEKPGGKLKKAEKHGIIALYEKEVLKIINGLEKTANVY